MYFIVPTTITITERITVVVVVVVVVVVEGNFIELLSVRCSDVGLTTTTIAFRHLPLTSTAFVITTNNFQMNLAGS